MIKKNKQFDEDWYESSLTKFPKIKSALTNRSQKQSKIHEQLIRDTTIRQQIDLEKTIQTFDKSMDVNYHLKRNPNYTNSKRNLKPISSFFERSIVNRIVMNVSKNNKKISHDYNNDGFAQNLVNATPKANHDCKRYKKNCQSFDNNEFDRIFFSIRDENEENKNESNSETKSVSQLKNQPSKLTPVLKKPEHLANSNLVNTKEPELDITEGNFFHNSNFLIK